MGKSQGGSNGRRTKNPATKDILDRTRLASTLIPFAEGWEKQPVEDGWKATNGNLTITYRRTTRTETDLPAVDIRWNRKVQPLTGLKSQRVHFLGGSGK